jgi:iron uptake system EfeUOB component EfeO/EfeM
MDDAGKLKKFFSREIKKIEGVIKDLEANLDVAKLQYDTLQSDLKDELEDATNGIEEAYEGVDVLALHNNKSMDDFSKYYWDKISAAEELVKNLNKRIFKEEEKYSALVCEILDQIDSYKARIQKISVTTQG